MPLKATIGPPIDALTVEHLGDALGWMKPARPAANRESSPPKNSPEKRYKPEDLTEKLQPCLFSSFQQHEQVGAICLAVYGSQSATEK